MVCGMEILLLIQMDLVGTFMLDVFDYDGTAIENVLK